MFRFRLRTLLQQAKDNYLTIVQGIILFDEWFNYRNIKKKKTIRNVFSNIFMHFNIDFKIMVDLGKKFKCSIHRN